MIPFDALYLLLFIELACMLAAGSVFFYLRTKKFRKLYLGVLKELSASKQVAEDLKKQMVKAAGAPAAKPSAPPAPPAPDPIPVDKRLEEMKKQLGSAETALKEKSEQLDQLQTKFTDLEKEYMILYHQQQKQQQG